MYMGGQGGGYSGGDPNFSQRPGSYPPVMNGVGPQRGHPGPLLPQQKGGVPPQDRGNSGYPPFPHGDGQHSQLLDPALSGAGQNISRTDSRGESSYLSGLVVANQSQVIITCSEPIVRLVAGVERISHVSHLACPYKRTCSLNKPVIDCTYLALCLQNWYLFTFKFVIVEKVDEIDPWLLQ